MSCAASIFIFFSISVGYQQFGNNGQVRLSPQQQQQMLNPQQMAFQTGTKPSNNSQLSPRQPPFPQQQGNQNPQQQQPNQPQLQQQQQQWNPAGTNRLSMQQQQNPMLNAQLQVNTCIVSLL